jgi:hypothetical protein
MTSTDRPNPSTRWPGLLRRIVVSAAAIAVIVLLAAGAFVAAHWDANVTAAAFTQARADQTTLRNFLNGMPKGGDLHVHLSGAVYAERYVEWGIADGLCLRQTDYAIVNPPCDAAAKTVPMQSIAGDQGTRDRIVNALSMRHFVPSPAEPSGHDHFFATFGKFGAAAGPRFNDMVLDLLAYYEDQAAQYVELMTSFSGYNERQPLVAAIKDKSGPKEKLDALDKAGLAAFVAGKKTELDKSVEAIEQQRGCDAARSKPGCKVAYRFIAQVSRNSPPDDVFVQTAIAAAIVRADPLVVGFNFVQPEDADIALKDYSAQMRTIAFLASNPPGKPVNVSLHAGELWLGLVPPADLTFHIREAVEIAGARRIGHGVDLAFEHDLGRLLKEMRERPVAVEINLSSNDQILGVRGRAHPFPAYRAAGVPVVLSTDDAAVERIDLTNEYVRAARDYGLSYGELKAIARASLTYSFLDDDAKKKELERFDASSADFERAVTARGSALNNIVLIVKTGIGWL